MEDGAFRAYDQRSYSVCASGKTRLTRLMGSLQMPGRSCPTPRQHVLVKSSARETNSSRQKRVEESLAQKDVSRGIACLDGEEILLVVSGEWKRCDGTGTRPEVFSCLSPIPGTA